VASTRAGDSDTASEGIGCPHAS